MRRQYLKIITLCNDCDFGKNHIEDGIVKHVFCPKINRKIYSMGNDWHDKPSGKIFPACNCPLEQVPNRPVFETMTEKQFDENKGVNNAGR